MRRSLCPKNPHVHVILIAYCALQHPVFHPMGLLSDLNLNGLLQCHLNAMQQVYCSLRAVVSSICVPLQVHQSTKPSYP